MSKYERFDLGRTKRYSVTERPSKVSLDALGHPPVSDRLSDFLDCLPDLLAGRKLRQLVEKMHRARELGKPLIWGFGGHVIKVGLGPILVDLMDRGFISAMATNGSGIIHDFELACWGKTSENVEQQLGTGQFGMASETGQWINEAISKGVVEGKGIGESIGSFLDSSSARNGAVSVCLQAFRRHLPLSVHMAIGTDIIHCHPEASGEALGAGSMRDFQIFTQQVSLMNDGGVYLNVGSAVILPEVFLKAVTVVRSSGLSLKDFTTVDLDFIRHYRPTQNVVQRPVQESGTGISLTGHHELMVPLLAALLIHSESAGTPHP
jgi:hypothetical protein